MYRALIRRFQKQSKINSCRSIIPLIKAIQHPLQSFVSTDIYPPATHIPLLKDIGTLLANSDSSMINRFDMKFGIPILANRVSPRCTFADSILFVELKRGRITAQHTASFEGNNWADLVRMLTDESVNTLVCSGISMVTREAVTSSDIEIVDNVVCSADEIIEAIRRGIVKPGFGISEDACCRISDEKRVHRAGKMGTSSDAADCKTGIDFFDCLTCEDRICLRGSNCLFSNPSGNGKGKESYREMLESALDVASESERTLCRLAELVYFCLGMKYKRIGLAYCVDLSEPARILAGVLDRFFNVFTVCCKVGGLNVEDTGIGIDSTKTGYHRHQVACNPQLQAEILNTLKTDLNVIVGLCVGSDCIFTRESKAPVTTIFVKDKSLANNPIGAVYSDHYLKDI